MVIVFSGLLLANLRSIRLGGQLKRAI